MHRQNVARFKGVHKISARLDYSKLKFIQQSEVHLLKTRGWKISIIRIAKRA